MEDDATPAHEAGQQVVAAEVAEREFVRWAEAMDLELDTQHMDAEDLTAFEKAKRRITGAICDGRLVIDDRGRPVFTPSEPPDARSLTFNEPTGATFMATDKQKRGHDIAKNFSAMAQLTRTNVATFNRMVGRDLKVCIALMQLFLD